MRRSMCIVLSLIIACLFLFSPMLVEYSGAATKTYNVPGGQLIFNTVTGSITGYTGDPVNLAIPSSIYGIKVKRLGIGSFDSCKSLISVALPEGLTTIEDRVFWDCDNLASVNIPDTVTSIGRCFAIYCNKLTSITIGAKNTAYTVQDGVLFDKAMTTLLRCPGGKSGAYIIPDTVKIIDGSAFYGNFNITGVTIPGSVTSIGDEAFTNCINLGDINLPASLTTLGYGAFRETRAESITVSADNKYFSSMDGVLFNKEKTILIAYPGSRNGSYTVPEGVASIADSAFSSCRYLTDVYIPKSVKNIGMVAFAYSSALAQVFFYGDAPGIGEYAFLLTAEDFKLYYLEGKKGFPIYGYSNEVFSQELQPPEGQPDLAITDIKWSPANPVNGDEVTFSIEVKNEGSVQYDAQMVSFVYFYVDGNRVTMCDTNDTPISPGQSVTLTADEDTFGKITWTAANGTYMISADVNSKIPETGLENNRYKKTLIVADSLPEYGDASQYAIPFLDQAVIMGFITLKLRGMDMNVGITREEFAELAVKFYEQITGHNAPLPEGKTFLDCDNPEVLKAFALNITSGVGDGTRFEPNSILTRQQMATMIIKTLKACYPTIAIDTAGQPDFKDQGKFASYAIEAAKFMAKFGITVGDGKGSFDPTSNCTREQTVIFLIKTYQAKDKFTYTSGPAPTPTPADTEQAVQLDHPYGATVVKLAGAANSLNLTYDNIKVTDVSPRAGLKAGVENRITVEVQYNLMDLDECFISIAANTGGTYLNATNGVDICKITVPKGHGTYRFTIPIVPKKWEDGSPFWVTALLRTDKSVIDDSQMILGIE